MYCFKKTQYYECNSYYFLDKAIAKREEAIITCRDVRLIDNPTFQSTTSSELTSPDRTRGSDNQMYAATPQKQAHLPVSASQ